MKSREKLQPPPDFEIHNGDKVFMAHHLRLGHDSEHTEIGRQILEVEDEQNV